MKNTISIYKHNGLKIMLVTQGHTLAEVLDAVEGVIRCSGYNIDGYLEITPEDEI